MIAGIIRRTMSFLHQANSVLKSSITWIEMTPVIAISNIIS